VSDTESGPQLGEVDREFFAEHVSPRLGADRADVSVGPGHGADFGVIEVGGQVVALATDPVVVLPSLGVERAARFAVQGLLSDAAVSGLRPTHLSVDLNLPPGMTDEQFATVWETVDREARDLGVSVVTGHTGRYDGCGYPMVGAGTTLSVGQQQDLVRPDGARVGDRVVVTKGPAVAATALLATRFESMLRESAGDAVATEATERLADSSAVRDALVASAAGPVTAMHDAAGCGLYGGLFDLARAADVRIDIERARVPVLPGIEAACECFGIDPWRSNSRGALLLTVDSEGVEDVLAALDSEGVPAADVGAVYEGSGLVVDGERTEHPRVDPFWAAMATFAETVATE
jgi:hydrogenase maturation factor